MEIGIAAFNDFHGALLPPHQAVLVPNGTGKPTPEGNTAIPAGGVAWMASTLDAVRAKYPNHVTVSAGDLISGSPITSSLFLDEPSVGAMNRMGLEFNALGNHEFDRGRLEILRMAHGGCEQYTVRKPCALEPYGKPRFTFLAANTLTQDGTPLLPPTGMKFFGQGKRRVGIGFIGMTLRGTGDISPPAGVKGLRWADEAKTANHYAPLLRRQGADVVALLIHQGGRVRNDPADPNGCTDLYGDIREILDRLDPSIDLVISGHTHWAYVCDYVGKKPNPDGTPHHVLLTSAGLWGEEVTDIDVLVDPLRHRMISAHAHNVVVQSDPYQGPKGMVEGSDAMPRFKPRPDIAAYVERYVAATKQYSARKVGYLAQGAAKTEGPESSTGGPLGHLIADAQLAATKGAGAQIAFMNPFGVRASLWPGEDKSLTFGQIYAVQPFGNQLMTVTMTGAQIKATLEEGFDTIGVQQALSPSAGFTYSYDRSHPVGERITGMTLHGLPLDPAASYRVTISDFLANGGDTFTIFTKGIDKTPGEIDLAALEAWLAQSPPRPMPADQRDIDLRPDLNPNRNTPPPGMHY
ncbi:MAG: bifunctional metallophosphatase/5'-nucleotidase [Sphingomonadales bacterium]|nr:bifunctional metallophosphatase/5'-nucleotidase [Sphingomonadales bacterium]MDE2168922.1 bifunctional metallophosphatase/5'-nucleotidase [Sphingomonadales bacterium]